MPEPRRKSWKREVAGACLLFVAAMVVWLFAMTDVAKINALVPLISTLGATVVVSGLAVFGLHYAKPPEQKP